MVKGFAECARTYPVGKSVFRLNSTFQLSPETSINLTKMKKKTIIGSL